MDTKRQRAACDWQPLHDYARQPTDADYAQLFGVARQTVANWRTTGQITPSAADRAATILGVHVCNIWPDFHERYSR